MIVEQYHRPVAVIKMPQAPGRKISECIALAKAYEEKLGYAPVPDSDFAKDAQAASTPSRTTKSAGIGLALDSGGADRRRARSQTGK